MGPGKSDRWSQEFGHKNFLLLVLLMVRGDGSVAHGLVRGDTAVKWPRRPLDWPGPGRSFVRPRSGAERFRLGGVPCPFKLPLPKRGTLQKKSARRTGASMTQGTATAGFSSGLWQSQFCAAGVCFCCCISFEGSVNFCPPEKSVRRVFPLGIFFKRAWPGNWRATNGCGSKLNWMGQTAGFGACVHLSFHCGIPVFLEPPPQIVYLFFLGGDPFFIFGTSL